MLDGVFSDEHGDYPAGTYLRNPPGSRHATYTGAEGALIYVKVGAIDAPFIPLPERNAQQTEAVICAGRNP